MTTLKGGKFNFLNKMLPGNEKARQLAGFSMQAT